jgi:hypothetical protein
MKTTDKYCILLERNKSLENSIKQQQAIIDDQAQEIEVNIETLVDSNFQSRICKIR